MPTLKELMGDLTRGDGRKFRLKKGWWNFEWFEPIFFACDSWFGIVNDGSGQTWTDENLDYWEPYTEPKEKKKVKLYRYILKNMHTNLYFVNHWQSESPGNYHYGYKVVGTEEMEIEVDE